MTACTNAACLCTSRTKKEEDETLLVDRGGRIKLVGSNLAGVDWEPFMSSQEFIEAYPCLSELIKTHYPGPLSHTLASAYDTHFRSMVDCIDFWSNVEVIITYVIVLQQRHLQVAFNPAVFQKAIWDDVWACSVEELVNSSHSYDSAILPLCLRDNGHQCSLQLGPFFFPSIASVPQ